MPSSRLPRPHAAPRADSNHLIPTGSAAEEPATNVAVDVLRTAMDQTAESVVIADATGRIVYANLAAERLIGRPRAELIDRHFVVALAPGRDAAAYDEISRAVGRGETWTGTHVTQSADGSMIATELVVSPVRDEAGRIANVVAIGRDVSRGWSLDRDQAQGIVQAGIVSALLARLEGYESDEERAQQLAAALTDLDGVALSRIVGLGPGEVWYRVAAEGQDEIILAGVRPPKALVQWIKHQVLRGAVVESAKVLERFGQLSDVIDTTGITAVAFAPIRHHGVLVGLLVAATTERAGVEVLEQHRSVIAELANVGSAMLGTSLAAREEAAGVRTTIERLMADAGYRPVYQPIVHMADGATIGYEALTRFDDGLSPAVRFAEAAAVGLGLELEIATLKAAFREAAALPAGAFLTVNVSPAVIHDGHRLVEIVRKSAQTRSVVLEITEREVVEDYTALRDAISRILVPVRWAIDDAGAGYSSLRHILELRPQYVKLDRALIADIALDPARQALVAGLLHFSKALGTTLIAEGIETESERFALVQLGVTVGQGYLFGRPAAAADWASGSTAVAPTTRSGPG